MNKQQENNNFTADKKRFYISLSVSLFLLGVMWIIYFFVVTLSVDYSWFCLFPREARGLTGVVLMPFMHGSLEHIFSNSLPFVVLLTMLLYFSGKKSYQIAGFIWLLTGTLIWLIARQACHIGASGLIYGYASFLFFSGIISRKKDLMAISIIVIFLYGSLIWGILPQNDEHISWEAHLSGFIAGTLMAVIYTKSTRPLFKISDKILLPNKTIFLETTSTTNTKITYLYTKKLTIENYIINYETDYYIDNNCFYNNFYTSTTAVF